MPRKLPQYQVTVADSPFRELVVNVAGTTIKQYYRVDENPALNSHIIKGVNGLRYMLLISSNAYEDREREIVQEKALKQYVDTSMESGDYSGENVLLFWHSDPPETAYDNRIGDIVYAELKHHFLIEIAKERDNTTIDVSRKSDGEKPFRVQVKAVWDAMETGDVEYGASIGFLHRRKDKQDSAYNHILKFETSVLPVEYAANAITLSEIVKDEK